MPVNAFYPEPEALTGEPAPSGAPCVLRLVVETTSECIQPLSELRNTIAAQFSNDARTANDMVDLLNAQAARHKWGDNTLLNVIFQLDNGGLWTLQKMTPVAPPSKAKPDGLGVPGKAVDRNPPQAKERAGNTVQPVGRDEISGSF